jgi:cytochrome c oxidase assembly protein subunit 11
MEEPEERGRANRRIVIRLLMVVIAMFGFGYALVPLYGVICDLTGFGGRTGRTVQASVADVSVDGTRRVTVEFVATVDSRLPWEFGPRVERITVRPGELMEVSYFARNLSNDRIIAQAVPSVAPGRAAKYFNKIECFCFTSQELAPGEARDMPVRFLIDPALPQDVTTLTMSYTFFASQRIAGGSAADAQGAGDRRSGS